MELLIALAVLAVTIMPIMGLFVMAAQNEAKARQLTIATVTAQMRMEELVGMTKDDLLGMTTKPTQVPIVIDKWKDPDSAGYATYTTVDFNKYTNMPDLAYVTVTVSYKDGTYTLEDILRVGRAE